MPISSAYAVPHPPLIIPEVGRGDEKKISATIRSYLQVADYIAGEQPETIVIVSPHAESYMDYFHIESQARARGDMRRFGVDGVSVEAEYDQAFIGELSTLASENDFPAGVQGRKGEALDHATMIPLYFINRVYDRYKLVVSGVSGLPPEDHYRLGMLISEASRRLDKKTVFIASGDLSHRLLDEGPYGFTEEGPVFDRQVTEALGRADFAALLQMDPDLCDRAGECGLRTFQVMAGALDGMAVKSELLSYEGPFGVGYGVAMFFVTGDDPSRKFI